MTEVDVMNAIVRAIEAPHRTFLLLLSIDGNQWCALYGADLQSGIAGFGRTPRLALEDFDRQFDRPAPQRMTSSHDGTPMRQRSP